MRKILVTGAAGFIGSNLVDALLEKGYEVVGYDNLSTGQMDFLKGALRNPRFFLHVADIKDRMGLMSAMEGCDFVFHLAANADVRHGLDHPERDLETNTRGTFNVLSAMRDTGVKKLAFASTGSVYGESAMIPTPELAPMPIQTSLYAASKVAGEGMISAMAEGGILDEAYIFRFVSILGERYTHGHVYDFYKQLVEHPDRLDVLGDGHQKKSYLYVGDCIRAMLIAVDSGYAGCQKHRTAVLNLGTQEFVEVDDSIRVICEEMRVGPEVHYTGGLRGWAGDSPFIFLDTQRMHALGWAPSLNIEQALRKTVGWLRENEWVFEKRDGKPLQRPVAKAS
jgi:UDP-glucose 4-epimerase